MTEQIEDAEVIGAELVVREEPKPVRLFATDDPVEVIEQATRVANALKGVVKRQNLVSRIKGRDHVRVEGWTLLGSMLGVFPFVEWSRRIIIDNSDGWEARVLVRTRDGAVVGAAEAECLRTESTWRSRDDYALRSMAQTRATSKAMRQPLGFVMTLAGFDPTPAEEMPPEEAKPEPKPKAAGKPVAKQRKQFDDDLAELARIAPGRDFLTERIEPWVFSAFGVTIDGLDRSQYDVLLTKVAGLLERAREIADNDTPFGGPANESDVDHAATEMGMIAGQEEIPLSAEDQAEADRIADEAFAAAESDK